MYRVIKASENIDFSLQDVQDTAISILGDNIGDIVRSRFTILQPDVTIYTVKINESGQIQVTDSDYESQTFSSLSQFEKFCRRIDSGIRQMNDEHEGRYSSNA